LRGDSAARDIASSSTPMVSESNKLVTAHLL
jgi:hypothetical protein